MTSPDRSPSAPSWAVAPAAIEQQYRTRHETLAHRYSQGVRLSSFVRLAVTIAAIATVWLVIRAGQGHAPLRLAALPLAAFLALLVWLLRIHSRQDRVARLHQLYATALDRARGVAPSSPITGADLRPEHHLFDRDLSILGDRSLFSLLATVRTGLGQRALADLLLRPSLSVAGIQARQQAVAELAPQQDLREDIALLGATTAKQLPPNHFDGWLDAAPVPFPRWAAPVLALLSTLLLCGLVLGASRRLPWSTVLPNLVLVAALQSAVALRLRPRVLPILAQSKQLEPQVDLLRDGLLLLRSRPLAAPLLAQLQAALPPSAPVELRRLHSLFTIAEQRTKEYFFVFSLLFATGTQTAIAVERWRQRNSSAMQQWIHSWSSFEALNALATFAHEHPDLPFPTLLDPTLHAATFHASDLAHPLLDRGISNSLTLDAAHRFLVISGSNMAGKSTLLRTVGVNTVLALAGAPVRASSLTLTPVALGTSIALADSLAEGRSKFRAEVERLRDLVALGQHPSTRTNGVHVLFLIDEILSGTNSVDRLEASDTILRSLLADGAIGALSTHDLALTSIAAEPGLHGQNMHMSSPDDTDPLAFDFRLRPGANTRSSAQAILQLLGLGRAVSDPEK